MKTLFILSILFSHVAYANLICTNVLKAVYNDGKIYQPGDCCINSARLLGALQTGGFDLNKARVLVIVKEQRKFVPVPAWMDSRLRPATNRNNDKEWAYHAIIETEGKILDLDYSPNPIPAKEYFAAVFPDLLNQPGGAAYNIEDRTAHVFLRAIPAITYKTEMDSIKNGEDRDRVFGAYRDQKPGGKYPLTTAKELLNSLP